MVGPRSTQATIIVPPVVMTTDEGPTLEAGALVSVTKKLVGLTGVAEIPGPPSWVVVSRPMPPRIAVFVTAGRVASGALTWKIVARSRSFIVFMTRAEDAPGATAA